MATAKKHAPNPKRNGLLAKIHIAWKDLGIPEDAYRDLLEGKFGVRSAGKLTIPQLSELLNHFIGCGWKSPVREPKRSGHRRDSKGKTLFIEIPAGTRFTKQKRYALALAKELGWSLDGLNKRIKRQFGVDHILWIDEQAQMQTLIKDMRNRCVNKGIDPDA